MAVILKHGRQLRTQRLVFNSVNNSLSREIVSQLVRRDPVVHRDVVRSRCRWLAEDPHQLLRLTEQFAPSTLEAPGMREAFVAWMNEAAAVSTEGYVDDWVIDCCDDG